MVFNRRKAKNYFEIKTTQIASDTWRNETKLFLRREGNSFKQVITKFSPFQDNLELQLESGVRPEIALQISDRNLCTVVNLLSPFARTVKYELKICNARGKQYYAIPQQQVNLQANTQYCGEHSKRVDQSLLDNKSLTISFVIQSQIDQQQSNDVLGQSQSTQNISQNNNNNNNNNNNYNTTDWTNVAQNIEVGGDLVQNSYYQYHTHKSKNLKIIIGLVIFIVVVLVVVGFVLILLSPWISTLIRFLLSAESVCSTRLLGMLITIVK